MAPELSPPPSQRSNSMVVQVLRDRIRSGFYRPGDWLPTERVLAEDLDVDRRVVRMAINALVQDGLVHRQPHCRPIVGPVVDVPEGGMSALPAASSSLASDFIALSMWPGGGVLENTGTSQQRIFWGMNHALSNSGHHAVFLGLTRIGDEAEMAVAEARHLRYVLERGLGGVVFYPYAYHSNQDLIKEISRKIPFVTIDRRIAMVETDFVGIDNRQAEFDATMHLIAQGHRRIAYVTKCEQAHPVQERIQGYIAAVRETNVAEIILTIPSRDREEAWQVVDTIFQLPPHERPTAAAVFNDYATVDLMRRLETFGLRVPDDVALVGFDNIIPTLPNGVGLTTIAQPYEEIGRAAVDLLMRRMKDPLAPVQSLELPAQLVVRESSAPPRE